MEFKRIKQRRKPNYTRAILLIVGLLLVVLIWFFAESIIERFFPKK